MREVNRPGQAAYTVTMTVRQWQIIDATLDNEVDTAVMNGSPPHEVGLGRSARQTGWEQIAGSEEQWPPDEEMTSITLTGPQWKLVIGSLERWSDIAERAGQSDDAQFGRRIRAVVSAQLPAWPIEDAR
ncbi:hypothetical protein E1211_22555 [Micromonospora sp. 15K316]|uniref:hypothetical protein n=1 Tax=Micromonospora sp. 15K316 TaxID=2530376 RepID=UPI001045B2F0|nr:hypothetical protein [Micromonospora sp. 15K316]TDC31400.1 hypothetical protein E1211_22555 [Micromonospora sp. 15K316]